MVNLRAMIALGIALFLGGCGGLSGIQDSAAKFGEAAHGAASAEMGYLRAVQVADCVNQFHTKAFDFAQGNGLLPRLAGPCTPTILDDASLAQRARLMDAITLYADKIAALATDDDDKALDASAQGLAGKLNEVGRKFGLSDPVVETDVEAAVAAIARMALDQRRFKDAREAAATMDQPLLIVVAALKAENLLYAQAIGSKIDALEVQLVTLLNQEAEQRGRTRGRSADPMKYFDALQARSILQSANPMGPLPFATAEAARAADPENRAVQLNAALDGIVATNHAIATAGTGGVVASVNDLLARARAAQAMQSALGK
jgi:hypothetical protein